MPGEHAPVAAPCRCPAAVGYSRQFSTQRVPGALPTWQCLLQSRSSRRGEFQAPASVPSLSWNTTCILLAVLCQGALHATPAPQENRLEHYRSETAAEPRRKGERRADRPQAQAHRSGRALQSAYTSDQSGIETSSLRRGRWQVFGLPALARPLRTLGPYG